MYRSRPRPGPITQQFTAYCQVFIFYIQTFCNYFLLFSDKQIYSLDINTGCTIIYGEYDLIDDEADLLQKM
jgi:hypothetical protein